MTGNYRISLHTPIGLQNGTISFVQEGEALKGVIRAMGNSNHFKNGKVNGNMFGFSGNLNLGLFNLSYNAKGSVDGDKLTATARTNVGAFQITGSKIA